MLNEENPQPAHKLIIQLVSSDNSFSHRLKIGKNNIVHPSLIPGPQNSTQFSLIMNTDGQICLLAHSYFPLLVISNSKTVKTYLKDCLIFFSDIESIRIHSLLSMQSYFYFNVIKYEVIDNEQVPYSTQLTINCKSNDDFIVSDAILTFDPKMLSNKRERKAETNKNDVDNECVICLETKSQPGLLDKCKHNFCKKCILNWSRSSSECPICKTAFTKIISGDSSQKIHKIPVKQKRFKYEDSIDEAGENWINNVAKSCMVCTKDDDNYLMLVCDNCEYNICHTYCAGLDGIPHGNWFCNKCERRFNKSKARSKTDQKSYNSPNRNANRHRLTHKK